MREMKDSGVAWIGEIPKEWKTVPAGKLFTEAKEKNTTLKYTNPLQFKYGEIVDKSYVGELDANMVNTLLTYTCVEPNTIMINGLNLNYDFVTQRVAIVKKSGVITSAYLGVTPNEHFVMPYYACYLLKGYDGMQVFHGMGSGVRKTLQWKDFKIMQFVLPPLAEQRRIADYLDAACSKVDALIGNQQAQIEKLKAYKQSLITEVVTRGLDPAAPMKDSGVEWIGMIPQGWEIKPLKALFSFGKGLPITKENLTPSGIPVISYGQIHAKWNSGVTIHEELKRFVSPDYLSSNPNSLVKNGDFIVADTSEDRDGCGNAAYVDTNDTLFAGYHTVILKSNSNSTNNKYLAYLFLTDAWRSQLRMRVSGIKVFSISRKILSETTVIIPENANNIADYLDDKCAKIDSLIAIKQQKIEKLGQYKKSLIYEYVTGKKEAQ